ncbi:hypothetical protein D3C76_1547380 [compost metagenome]
MLQRHHVGVGQNQRGPPCFRLQPVIRGIVQNGEHDRPHLEVNKSSRIQLQGVQAKQTVVGRGQGNHEREQAHQDQHQQ